MGSSVVEMLLIHNNINIDPCKCLKYDVILNVFLAIYFVAVYVYVMN
jgi:hypothetical protein